MAVAFDNTSGQIFASLTNWDVTKPAHVHDGDLIIATVVEDTTGTINTVPAGFNIIGAAQQGGAGDCELRVYWKIASSEPATWTWIWAAARAGQVEITTYTGAATPTPIGTTVNVDYRHDTSPSGTAIDAGPITPGEPRCMIVSAMGADPGGSPTMTATAPAQERVDRINGATSWIGLEDWLQGAAAAVTLSATMTAVDTYAWNVFAIRPVPSLLPPQVMVYS